MAYNSDCPYASLGRLLTRRGYWASCPAPPRLAAVRLAAVHQVVPLPMTEPEQLASSHSNTRTMRAIQRLLLKGLTHGEQLDKCSARRRVKYGVSFGDKGTTAPTPICPTTGFTPDEHRQPPTLLPRSSLLSATLSLSCMLGCLSVLDQIRTTQVTVVDVVDTDQTLSAKR